MASAPKKTAIAAVSAEIAGPILTLTFGNGNKLTLDANALTPDIQQAALMHGLKQKLIDAAAISRNPDTGATATNDDKYAAVAEVFKRITDAAAPMWNKVRGNGEGGGTNKGGLLVRAMMRITSKSRADIVSFLDAKSKDEIAALRKNPRIAEVIAQLQIEQANTSGVDSDALLDSLMDGAELAEEGAEGEAEEEPDSIGLPEGFYRVPASDAAPATAETGNKRVAKAKG